MFFIQQEEEKYYLNYPVMKIEVGFDLETLV